MKFVSIKSNTTGVTSGAGTANPSTASEFTPVFIGAHVAQSFIFFVDQWKFQEKVDAL